MRKPHACNMMACSQDLLLGDHHLAKPHGKATKAAIELRILPCTEAWFRWGLLINYSALTVEIERKKKTFITLLCLQEDLLSPSQINGSLIWSPLQSANSPCIWLCMCHDGFSTFCHDVFIAVLTVSLNNLWLPSE